MYRAIGHTRAKPIGKSRDISHGRCGFAYAASEPDEANFIIPPAGVLVTANGDICHVSDALLDTIFDDMSFKPQHIAHDVIFGAAAQMYNLIPSEFSRGVTQVQQTVSVLNDAFGEGVFHTFKATRAGIRKQKEEDPSLIRGVFDSRVPRAVSRGDAAKYTDATRCTHCHRVVTPTQRLKPLFARSSDRRRFCEKCILRYRGKLPPVFSKTRDHFAIGKAARSPASRKYVRLGPPSVSRTAVEVMLHLYDDSDIRELVGWTFPDKVQIKTKASRIMCGTLLLAMPLFRHFKDGLQTPRSRPYTKLSTMMSIFRSNPQRAAALCDLERRTRKMWTGQNWRKLAADGRVFVKETDIFTQRMKTDAVFNLATSERKCTAAQLLIWIDMPNGAYPFPVMMSATSAAMLHLIFVQHRVAVDVILDSEDSVRAPPGSSIASLDLSLQQSIEENMIIISGAEILTYDLLLWILDRPLILGTMDVCTVVVRGNYSAAVRNMSDLHFGYNLGRAFVELADAAIDGVASDVLSLTMDPLYGPEHEMGIAERCAELEVAAYRSVKTPASEHDTGLAWPPALPFDRPVPDVSLSELVEVMNANSIACEGVAEFMTTV